MVLFGHVVSFLGPFSSISHAINTCYMYGSTGAAGGGRPSRYALCLFNVLFTCVFTCESRCNGLWIRTTRGFKHTQQQTRAVQNVPIRISYTLS